jgi:uncharacterized BrkB/YihY/UPF0761 family membrane protein
MAPFRWLALLIGALWRFSRSSWIDVGMGLRPRSGASGLVLFLFLIFFLIGLVLVLFGVDLGDLDRWLEAHADTIDAVASFLFRALSGLVLLACALTFAFALLDRRNPDRPGCGCLLAAAAIGYFAWFGMTG